MECKECCREISKETYKDNEGLCYKCHKEKQKEEAKAYKEKNKTNNNENDDYETSILAGLLKVSSIIDFIASFIVLIIFFCGELEFFVFSYVFGSAVILYILSEIITLLWNIRENLEYIRKKK